MPSTDTATPRYTDGTADGTEDLTCEHCGVPVVLDYDGRGTGWFHLPLVDTPAMHSGKRHCA